MMDQFLEWPDIVAGTANRLRDVTRPRADGDKVNVHVIPAVIEPLPDFEAMRRLVAGPAKKEEAAKKDECAAA